MAGDRSSRCLSTKRTGWIAALADMKNLPHKATWIFFRGLHPDTTEEEVIDLIAQRTGIRVDTDHISVDPHPYFPDLAGAVVCLESDQIGQLLSWALSEDTLHGRRMQVHGRQTGNQKH